MYKIRKASNNANRATDSVRANPSSAYPISCLAIVGLREALLISALNTIPIPAPTPASAITALPAPINFAASTINRLTKIVSD